MQNKEEIVKDLIIPRSALPYILLQRTGYAIPLKKFFARIERVVPYLSVSLQSFFFAKKIKKEYSADVAREFAMLQPYLPEHADTVLDIGCGVAGFDVPIYRHYGRVQLFLLDRTEKDPIHYGFQPRAAFYNSLECARDLLVLNGVQKDDIHLFAATEDYSLPPVQFDLIFSLIAWGFHFPLETYLQGVYDALKPGGVLIVDVRANTQGEETLRKLFGNAAVIHEGKNRRIVCRKQAVH